MTPVEFTDGPEGPKTNLRLEDIVEDSRLHVCVIKELIVVLDHVRLKSLFTDIEYNSSIMNGRLSILTLEEAEARTKIYGELGMPGLLKLYEARQDLKF